MKDITKIPIVELERDLMESNKDIAACEQALMMGILTYNGESVKERLEDNKHFIEIITKELKRRNNISEEKK